MTNLETAAREYVDLLNGQPNGHGQHVHPVYGISHSMLARIGREFGREAADAAIDAEFKRRRDPRTKAYLNNGFGPAKWVAA